MQGIENLQFLKCLRLRSKHISDADVAQLATLPQLISLNITSDATLTDKALESIGRIKTLKHISIDSFPGFTDAGIGFLQELNGLEALSLRSSKYFTGSGLAYLINLPNLTDLSLRGIDDRAMINIGNMNSLRALGLYYSRVTNVGIKHLRNLDKLVRLNLQVAAIDDNGLEHLSYLSNLLSLSVTFWPVPDVSAVTDRGSSYIGALTKLESLILHGVQVTDDAVIHLSKLTNLRYLGITKSQISQIAINQLTEALPNCKINI